MPPAYEHTQRAPLWLLLAAVVAGAAAGALATDDRAARVALSALAVLVGALALSFMTLTVADRGDHLAVRFGPLPLWGTAVRYEQIRAVRIGRSRLLDGWGVHWLPGRGWTYNLWGFACVELTVGKGVLRIGTDDAEGLAAFLAARTGSGSGGATDWRSRR